MTQCEEIEVCGMSQSASVIESEDVEEESDEEDQEAHDQCQNEEVRSSATTWLCAARVSLQKRPRTE